MGRAVLREVELVEGDAPDDPRPPLVRWRRWWPVPVLVVALAVAAQASLDARARAEDARLAALPGTLAPVGSTLDVIWTVPLQDVPVVMAGHEVDGAYVGARQDLDGTYAATAIDALTGRARWAVPLDAEHPRVNPRFDVGEPQCLPGAEGSGRMYCLAGTLGRAGRTVLTIDTADGSVLRTVDVPAADEFAVDGTSTFLLRARGGTVCDVTGVDGAAVSWTTSVPCDPGSDFVVGGGLVAVSDWGSQVTVLDRSGSVLLHVDRAGAEVVGDALVVVAYDDRGLSSSRLLRAGQPTVEVAGAAMVPRVDDGSAAGIVVTTDRTTQGYDSRTGRRLWSAPISLAGSPLVRDGEIVDSGSGDVIVSIDARSGRVRHRLAMHPDARSSDPLTDGRRFLGILREGAVLPPHVLAVGASGGGVVQELRLPPDVIGLQQSGRRLLGIDADGTVHVLG